MVKVVSIIYTRGTAKVYLSDGSQSPKLEAAKVYDWIKENT